MIVASEHVEKIIDTYRERPGRIERYARRVDMVEIEGNEFNLNISEMSVRPSPTS